jgi:hypothetical protein
MGLPHENTPVDTTLDGHPFEIKSCQLHITDSHCSNHMRSGRFVLDAEQHHYLLENGGLYGLIVHEQGVVHRTRIIKAEDLPVEEFTGVRSVPWTTTLEVIT